MNGKERKKQAQIYDIGSFQEGITAALNFSCPAYYSHFSYVPMVVDLSLHFRILYRVKGCLEIKRIGLKNFEYVFNLPGFGQAMKNTVIIGS